MKVLLVCESFDLNKSGGRAARFIHSFLSSVGCDVKIFLTSSIDYDSDISHKIQKEPYLLATSGGIQNRATRFGALISTKIANPRLKKALSSFNPDIVHFASFDHTKPNSLYWLFYRNNIPVVLQPWTMHFFCAQGFGYKYNKQCYKCIDQGVHAAFSNKCVANVRGIVGQIEKHKLRNFALKAKPCFLSSNTDLDSILELYGISSAQVYRFPVPFDASAHQPYDNKDNGRYIYYGQADEHKGLNLLISLFTAMPSLNLVICPMTELIFPYSLPSNIRILNGLKWGHGLVEQIAAARAVIVPSLWATSTEYTLCEAMAMQKPVIAFNVGAHKHILRHRDNSWILDYDNIEKACEAILAFDSDEAIRNAIAVNGRRDIVTMNSPQTLGVRLLDIYRQVIDQHMAQSAS